MNDLKITHLYAPNPGGINDYVNEILKKDVLATRLAISKNDNPDFFPEYCLLHYSGYGFAKRGAPLWLIKKLEKDRAKIKVLGIYFHELYAFGPPWRSSFWLSPTQRHIARRLAEICDFWITNREGSAQWLRGFTHNKSHATIPVFSNVGETITYSQNRLPKIVIFGGAALRCETYQAAGESLFKWAYNQGLEIHDIGPTLCNTVINDSLARAGVIVHGRLEPEEITQILSDAEFGLVNYPVEYVAKSGVYAAYCAHGICPIIISKNNKISDGLISGQHYLTGIPKDRINNETIAYVGHAAWKWYQPHCISSHISTQQGLFS